MGWTSSLAHSLYTSLSGFITREDPMIKNSCDSGRWFGTLTVLSATG